MANSKRAKFKAAVERIPKSKLGSDDLLSEDLPERIGSLLDKNKITIRLDLRVLDAAKREADKLGVGYQKIINDRLLEMYSLDEVSYLNRDSSSEIKELAKQVEQLTKRLNKVERTKDKKQA